MPTMAEHGRRRPAILVGVIALLAAAAVSHTLSMTLPFAQWRHVILRLDLDDPRQLLLVYSVLPRLAVSLLGGAALALAGTIFQQVMRNPLAEPGTLGVSAGASLALTLALAFAPGLLAYGREWVAFIGAAIATLAVFGLAARRSLSPLALVLAGMIVALYCGALAAGVQLFENPYMLSIYLWGAGSLAQQDWSVVLYLLPRLAIGMALAGLLVRPLTLLGLEDDSARSLGVSLLGVRVLALIVAVALSACVVSAVGVIGFVGLAGPALVRFAGARRFGSQLIWAPLLGAGLLCLTDQIVQWASAGGPEFVATGAATSLLGAPLLIVFLLRLRLVQEPPRMGAERQHRAIAMPWTLIVVLLAGLTLAIFVSLHLGQDGRGWHWAGSQELSSLLRWRAPRLAGAVAAGAMLAVAGVLLQRMTGNPMAAPEILGISGGAAMGLIALLMISQGESQALRLIACTAGSAAVLVVILLLGRRSAYAPDRLLLAGIALNALLSALLLIFMTSGSMRVGELQRWMAGGTDLVSSQQAWFAGVAALAFLGMTVLVRRWLAIFPLGSEVPLALGLNLRHGRVIVLLMTAALTGAATLTVGPLGFAGLMGPHLARMMGFVRPLPQLVGAALLGALIMALADWLGRNVMFPYQVPAGLVATLIGGPYLMLLLRRRVG